jgi:hypothetical protein
MANIIVNNIQLVSQNPSLFTEALKFEICFESIKQTKESNFQTFYFNINEVEWKVIYFGDSTNEKYD